MKQLLNRISGLLDEADRAFLAITTIRVVGGVLLTLITAATLGASVSIFRFFAG